MSCTPAYSNRALGSNNSFIFPDVEISPPPLRPSEAYYR